MTIRQPIFGHPQSDRAFGWIDVLILVIMGSLLYLGIRLALNTPDIISGPQITLEAGALPFYAFLSLRRMLLAYGLSLGFSLAYGYIAARRPGADRWLLPVLDILQSVPILSFLPVVLLSLTSILPQQTAVELASIILIFTSQAWNLTFSFYQSLSTLPKELREAAAMFRFSPWLRFRTVELPFASIGLIWNSVMSWAGGWFFLMAAEIFVVGNKDFRLPGLGAYLQTAAAQGDSKALLLGISTLVLIIILLDQLIWRPLLAWAERFKVSQVESDVPATSWFYNNLRASHLAGWASALLTPVLSRINQFLNRPPAFIDSLEHAEIRSQRTLFGWLILILFGGGIAFGILEGIGLLSVITTAEWLNILVGAAATLLRVGIAVSIALAWTIPVGVLIGTNARAARLLQPIVQILAAIPATALFPMLLIGLVHFQGGTNIAAVLLMLLGTQWYLLFNVIAGASAIPLDLIYTSNLMRLKGWRRWRTLILPSLFPYIITGLITATGGAWNASIVAEHTSFGGQTYMVTGLGSTITAATAQENYALLLASTLIMIIMVVTINRFFFRRLFHIAQSRFQMDQ